jgi:hypothetical protein
MKTSVVSILFALLVACGTASDERDFSNPADPDVKDEQPKHSPAGSHDDPSSTETGDAAGDDVDVSISPVCLSDCALNSTLSLNFNQGFDILPSNCTAAKQVYLVPGTPAFTVLINATCNNEYGIFAVSWNPDTKAIVGEQTKLGDCGNPTHPVSYMVSATGDTSVAIEYQCQTSTSVYASKLLILNRVDRTIKATNSISTSISDRWLSVSWNQQTSEYGVFYTNRFMRFNSSAVQVGGTGVIDAAGIFDVRTISGNWVVLSGSYYTRKCSKVSNLGTVLCNGKSLPEHVGGFLNDNYLVSVNSASYSRASFDVATCNSSVEATEIQIVNSISSSPTVSVYGSGSLTSSIGYVMFHNGESLVIGTQSLGTAAVNSAEAVVSSFSTLDSTQTPTLSVINGKVYVTTVVNGKARLALSSISAQ